MHRLEASLKERKKRGAHRSRTTEHKVAMNRIGKSTRGKKKVVPMTGSHKAGKTRIRISQSRADPLEPVKEDGRWRRSRGTEEIFEQSAWRRRNRRRARSLRKEIDNERHHLTKFRASSLRRSRRRRSKATRKSVRRRILRKILLKTKRESRRRIRRSGRGVGRKGLKGRRRERRKSKRDQSRRGGDRSKETKERRSRRMSMNRQRPSNT